MSSATLIAYHNDHALKASLLAKMAKHREADELVKGVYWSGGKGCAVGCLLESSDHGLYESRFGIPQVLARLEDEFFEGLTNAKAQLWPERFLSAIQPGADLSRVGWQFIYWNLTDNLILDDSENEDIQKVVLECRAAIKQCADVIEPLAKAAYSAADRAANAANAASAAYSAAYRAREACYSRMADKLIELLEAAPIPVAAST
jgi:hypothetical protein